MSNDVGSQSEQPTATSQVQSAPESGSGLRQSLSSVPIAVGVQFDRICDAFELQLRGGESPQIVHFLHQAEEAWRPALLRDLLPVELSCRRAKGESPVQADYEQQLPAHIDIIRQVFQQTDRSLSDTSVVGTTGDFLETTNPSAEQTAVAKTTPSWIGRYEVKRTLGRGAFGIVYAAFDQELQRNVAIKVPHADRVSEPADVESYLDEARLLARLDHPHIVPVHDVGRTDDGRCFVVSKLIEGSDLRRRIANDRPPLRDAAELIATIAEALHYAHQQKVVHRDIKPANILLDTEGHAFLADFGLALKDEDYGTGEGFAGTPAYMSPEQARGEGHLVDGRSDIFSLGIVFYELLTGCRPFGGSTARLVLEHIKTGDLHPPRQRDKSIPAELERICLKALAQRIADRYQMAVEMAADLSAFLASSQPAAEQAIREEDRVKVRPQGLRSFGPADADFFLELLPGPRDREGLPESIRFWKTRIESTDPDQTFRVGVLYGPSGCGKSSLVKAGLLPDWPTT